MCAFVEIPLGELFQLFKTGRDHFKFQLSINFSGVQHISLYFLQRENRVQL